MAAYAALAFLSFLWGSSFLLIKIAARAFDPFGFALARVGVAASAMLLVAAFSGKIWPGSRPGLWAKLAALALIGQVLPFLLLGEAAALTTSADMALMMGAGPIFVFLFGRFLGSRDRWTALGALGLALGFAGVGLALWSPGTKPPRPIPRSDASTRLQRLSATRWARSSRAPRRGRSARSGRSRRP